MQCTSCFCGQSLFALASAGFPRALALLVSSSVLQAWILCGSEPGGSCPWNSWERKTGEWVEEGALETARLGGVDL